MAQRVYEDCFLQISPLERLKIRFFAFFIGVWIILKQAFWTLWKPEKKSPENRDKPLTCLVDNTLGYHSYIKLQGVKLHYVEIGEKNLPLLVLLHGFPDCWLGWRHQMKVFSTHFRVVAVDLKGFGDSDKPAWRTNYKIKTIVQELHELVTSLDSYRCTIIGHDLGAHVGWYFVTCYPDLVDNFVAISCPHPNVFWDYLPHSSIFNSRWISFCQLPLLPEMQAGRSDIAIIDDCLSHLHSQKEEKLIDAYKYVFSRPEDWTGPINYYRNLPLSRIHQGYKVIVPTLLIVGSKDPFIQLESVVKSTEYSKKFLLKIVDGAGHFPHQENPELVNKLLLSFLTVPATNPIEKTESSKGLIGSLYSNTMKYGSSLVDNVKKTTNGVVWLPSQMLIRNS